MIGKIILGILLFPLFLVIGLVIGVYHVYETFFSFTGVKYE